MNKTAHFEVYFDFDNTITSFDVLDDLIQRFAIDDSWEAAEREWENGAISSKACLEQQLAVVRVTKSALAAYLSSIRIDPAFPRILAYLRSHGVEPVIVSDSFRNVIEAILGNNGIHDVKVLANELKLDEDRALVEFPYFQSICSRCANCKTSHLMRRDRPENTKKIYIGDGRSDICPAGFCEIIFAKASLLKHYAPLRPDCIPFTDLTTVERHLQSIIQ